MNKYATFSFKDTRYDENTTKPITLITALIFRFSILSILQQIKRTPITIGENKIAIKINIIFCLLKISFDNCFFSLSLMSKYWYSNIREAWSGTLFPNSHFEIVYRVTKTTSASCCWVKPFSILADLIKSDISIVVLHLLSVFNSVA